MRLGYSLFLFSRVIVHTHAKMTRLSTRLGSSGVPQPKSKIEVIDADYESQLDAPYNLPPRLQEKILIAARILSKDHGKDRKMPSSIYVTKRDKHLLEQQQQNVLSGPAESADDKSTLARDEKIRNDEPLLPLLDGPSSSTPPQEATVEQQNSLENSKGPGAILNMKRSRKKFFRRINKSESPQKSNTKSFDNEGNGDDLNDAPIVREALDSKSLFDTSFDRQENIHMSPTVVRSTGTATTVLCKDSPVSYQSDSSSTISSLTFSNGGKDSRCEKSSMSSSKNSKAASKGTTQSTFLTWLDSTLDVISNGASLCSATAQSACVTPSASYPKEGASRSSRELRGPF